jgi:hypothetical protein
MLSHALPFERIERYPEPQTGKLNCFGLAKSADASRRRRTRAECPARVPSPAMATVDSSRFMQRGAEQGSEARSMLA